jgi:hypothetical protein
MLDLPLTVTDDLYTCLAVVRQGYRFVFEPRARACIQASSRDRRHELRRRRRIVSRSLHGIWLSREVLNPLRHGLFAVNLLINKVLRRLLPVFLILTFVSSVLLAFAHPAVALLLAGQAAFYLLALSYRWILPRSRTAGRWARLGSVAYYVCLGNLGNLLGVVDFVRGKRVAKW